MSQIGSFPQIGVKIPKIFELSQPRKQGLKNASNKLVKLRSEGSRERSAGATCSAYKGLKISRNDGLCGAVLKTHKSAL